MDDEIEQLKQLFGSSSTLDSLLKIHKSEAKKSMPKSTKKRAKRTMPEKDVVKHLMLWMTELGWDISIVEAKGVRLPDGSFRSGQVESGYSDMSGNTTEGLAVYVEAKAPGKRSTLKDHQRAFLVRKIKTGSFACCADSLEHLSNLYRKYLNLKCSSGHVELQHLLLSDLPQPRKKRKTDSDQGVDVDPLPFE